MISTYPTMPDSSTLLQQHEKLIRYMAQPFFGHGVAPDDLLQDGRLAFLEAISKFSEEKGVAIWTYARPFVLHALIQAVSRQTAEPAAPNSDPDLIFNVEEDEYAPSPEDLFIAKEDRLEVRRAISKLEAEDAELLAMWMSSSSFEELGELRGVKRSAAHTQVKQLVERIREAMGRAA